jgi:hypothetical protein
MVNMAMTGGAIFTRFKKNAMREQSTKIKSYGLSAIILLLRLVPWNCWLVVVLVQNDHCHGQWGAQQILLLLFGV